LGVLMRAPGEEQGRGLWRLNPDLLSSVVDKVDAIIKRFLDALPPVDADTQSRSVDLNWWFEKLLKTLVGALKVCSKLVREERRQQLHQAQQEVCDATEQLHRTPGDAGALDKLLPARRVLAAEEEQLLKAARERARKSWFCEGERPYRSFYRVVQARQRARTLIGELVEARNPSLAARLAATEQFYRDLYTRRNIVEEDLEVLLAACARSRPTRAPSSTRRCSSPS
jgi:hypothetical protein